VYSRAHVGHARFLIASDSLVRYLRARGLCVTFVRNFTDIDDKMIRRATEEKISVADLAEREIAAFTADVRALACLPPNEEPRATAHIPHMIALVERLIAKGHAYAVPGGSVYFRVRSFAGYGKLSHRRLEDMETGEENDPAKEAAQDFALWKGEKPGEPAWDTPWGRGRPGWHLECSAMAMDILGETLDLHCGGIDLVFPHHEDEIAQSEAATGRTFSRVWCHGEFLQIDSAKMAKRVGNVVNVQTLRDQGISGAAIRHLVFSTHYRQQLNLQSEAMEGAKKGAQRIGTFAVRLAEATGGTPGLAAAAEELERTASEALFDDLNAPQALAALHVFVNRANAELDQRGSDGAALEAARRAFAVVNGVLDVAPSVISFSGGSTAGASHVSGALDVVSPELLAWIEERLAARREARSKRDFKTSDAIRDELRARGIEIEDTPDGTRWKRIE
jgi:cysteinyl-tRNA synthetase